MQRSATNQGNFSSLSPSKPGTTAKQERFGRRNILALLIWLTVCSALVFSRTFRIPYAFDDLDHLHAVTTFRTGQISFWTWFLHNHNEHIVPSLRLYFLAGTWMGGLNAFPLHIMIFLTYVAGAVACAWAYFSVTKSRSGALLASTVYAIAGGFSGAVVWQPTTAQFSIAGTPLIFAIAVLTTPERRSWLGMLSAFLLVILGAMGMGAAALAALAIPIYLYLTRKASTDPRKTSLAILASMSLIATILLATRWIMALHGIHHALAITPRGTLGGLFLIFTVPGRFLLAWVPSAEFPLHIDLAMSAVGWIILILSLRWVPAQLRPLIFSLWVGDCVLAFLIGLGRFQDSYQELFITDRYYFFFLFPLSLQAGALLSRTLQWALRVQSPARKLTVSGVSMCVLVGAIFVSHKRLDAVMPWDIIKEHKRGFWEIKALAGILKARAAQGELHLADGPVWVPGIHKDHIALACVVFTQYPHGLPGIRWTLSTTPPTNVGAPWNVPRISDEDAAVENQILDEWSKATNRHNLSCLVNGRMRDITDSKIANCEEAVESLSQ